MSDFSPIISPAAFNPSSQAYQMGKRTGQKRSRQEMEIVSQVPSQTVRQITRFPMRRRGRRSTRAIHNFKRTFAVGAGTLTTDGINSTYVGWNFSMNDMPGYTELTSLYDFYKLNGVLVRVIPYQQTQSVSIGSVNNATNTPIFYAIDRSDSTAPGTVGEVLEYQDHKIATSYRGFNLYVKAPKFADATSAVRGGWVSTSNATLNWNGLKIAIPPTGNANSFYVTWTFYVSCKDPK